MNNNIYYRTGKYDAKKGYMPLRTEVATVAQQDEYRERFMARVQSDEIFRKAVGWTKKPVAEYLKEYRRRPTDEAYAPEGSMMCSRLYELGTYDKSVPVKTGEIAVKSVSGKSLTFDTTVKIDPPGISRFDESHLAAEPADDVCRISGFGEAALLLCMRRRLIEKLHIYTYVGDIVLCVNPYMRIPAMEKIHGDRWCPYYVEGEERKRYALGSDPHSFAAAYLAYWGQRSPEDYSMDGKVDQSCIVSGESGAGKTVACSLIMKFLARCSLWRQEEIDGKLCESLPTGSITNRIGGCSPFLEAFGNAKTVMNDNSSRFGKFTKVIFHDGLIVAAKMEAYLLERARLVGQGIHERNFHIFYFLIKGAHGPNYKTFLTDELRDLLALGDVTDYDIIKRTPIIAREEESHPGFDEYKMTAALSPTGNHDDTGVVAALEDTGMPREEQHNIWMVLALCLHLGNLQFKDSMGEGGNMGSAVKNRDELNIISKILLHAVPGHAAFEPEALERALGSIVTVMRSERYSRPVPARQAVENRDAFIKALYAQVFDTLFQLCNRKLNPNGIEEGPEFPFVGILDIFGFEVFQKNSLEQLCINFANEKLQNLFNEHVFMNEKKVYEGQGMDTSDKNVFPPYRDNGPCCDLVAKSSGKFVGIFPGLDSLSVNDDATDKGFLESLIKTFGRGTAPPKNCNVNALRRAAAFFEAADFVNEKFQIRHFAGPVVYHIDGFLDKNRDKVATNIRELCDALQGSLFHFPCLAADGMGGGAASPGSGGGKSPRKKQMKTIASKFRQQLTNLANTLKATNPHYVRCVKPNDYHMRPIDGNICFDEWKTYEQLLFAGVMECVKIKRSGFPFRENHDAFFRNRVLRCNLHKFVPAIDPTMDAKMGCEIAVRTTLPELAEADEDTGLRRKFWFLGTSLVMGKDNLVEVMSQWLQRQAANRLVNAARLGTIRANTHAFVDSLREVQRLWRLVLFHRRFIPAVEQCQEVWRKFHAAQAFRDIARALSRIQITRESTVAIQKSFRASTARAHFVDLWKALVRHNASKALQQCGASVVATSRVYIATAALQNRLLLSLHSLRKTFRVQAHFRGAAIRFEHLRRVSALRNTTACAVKGLAVWRSLPERALLVACRQSAVLIQAVARMRLASRAYRRVYRYIVLVQAVARRVVYRSRYLRRLAFTMVWQRWCRAQAIRRLALRSTRAGLKLVQWMKGLVFATRTQQFLNQMDYACSNGDTETAAALLACRDSEFRCLRPLRAEVVPSVGGRRVAVNALVNLRDPTFFTSFLHSAAKSGNAATVQLLVDAKAWVDVRDAALETPLHQTCSNGDPMLEVNRILLEHSTWRTGGPLVNAALEEQTLRAAERRSSGAGGAGSPIGAVGQVTRRASFRGGIALGANVSGVSEANRQGATERAAALAAHDRGIKWIVSIAAQSLREQTVLDCALGCVDYAKDETVALLLSERAQASIDVEKVLEDEYQQKQNLLIVEARRRKQMEDQEEEERHKDQLYNLLFLDNSQPDRISLETRAALRAKQQQKERRHVTEHLMMSAIVALQAVVRMWLRRRARDEEAIMDLRPLAERAADAEERREAARQKREQEAALRRAKQRRAAHGTRRMLQVLTPEQEQQLLQEQEDAAARVLTMEDRAKERAKHVAQQRVERQKNRKEQLIRERRERQRKRLEEEQNRFRAEQMARDTHLAVSDVAGELPPSGLITPSSPAAGDARGAAGAGTTIAGSGRSVSAAGAGAEAGMGREAPNAVGSVAAELLSKLKPEEDSYDVLSHSYTRQPVKGIAQFEADSRLQSGETRGDALVVVSATASGAEKRLPQLSASPVKLQDDGKAITPATLNGARLSIDEQYEVLRATYPDRRKYVKTVAAVQAAERKQEALQTQLAQAEVRAAENQRTLQALQAQNYCTQLKKDIITSAATEVVVPRFHPPGPADLATLHAQKEKHDFDAQGISGDQETRKLLLQALHVYRAVVASGYTDGAIGNVDDVDGSLCNRAKNMRKWLYKDDAGDVHGPFSEEQMQHWYRRGFFAPDLLIANGLQPSSFAPLVSVFGHDVGSAFDSRHHGEALSQGVLAGAFERVARKSRFIPSKHPPTARERAAAHAVLVAQQMEQQIAQEKALHEEQRATARRQKKQEELRQKEQQRQAHLKLVAAEKERARKEAVAAERKAALDAADEAARQAEAERKAAAERRAEAERQAEAERRAEAERQAEVERRAEAERQAEAERRVEAERQAEAERRAEAERQAEAERRAEAERQAEVERKAQAAWQAEAVRKAQSDGQAEQNLLCHQGNNDSQLDVTTQGEGVNDQHSDTMLVSSKSGSDAASPADNPALVVGSDDDSLSVTDDSDCEAASRPANSPLAGVWGRVEEDSLSVPTTSPARVHHDFDSLPGPEAEFGNLGTAAAASGAASEAAAAAVASASAVPKVKQQTSAVSPIDLSSAPRNPRVRLLSSRHRQQPPRSPGGVGIQFADSPPESPGMRTAGEESTEDGYSSDDAASPHYHLHKSIIYSELMGDSPMIRGNRGTSNHFGPAAVIRETDDEPELAAEPIDDEKMNDEVCQSPSSVRDAAEAVDKGAIIGSSTEVEAAMGNDTEIGDVAKPDQTTKPKGKRKKLKSRRSNALASRMAGLNLGHLAVGGAPLKAVKPADDASPATESAPRGSSSGAAAVANRPLVARQRRPRSQRKKFSSFGGQ